MADFIQALDPFKLVLFETGVAFSLSPFTAPPYNLPIFLFGIYAQENAEAIQSLQTFTALLGFSAIFDIIWMATNAQNGFLRLITIIILLLKIPTFLAFASALRQRGSQFTGLGIRGTDLSGPTVWSMPGGFTSQGGDGYQTVEEQRAPEAPRPPHPGPVPPPAANRFAPSGTPAQYQSA